MTGKPPMLLQRIGQETRFLLRQKLLLLLAVAMIVFLAPSLALGLIDAAWPLREATVLPVLLILAAAAVIYLFFRLIRFRSQLPDARDVALTVEGQQPELMDSLICAVELLRNTPEKQRTGLHKALLSDVEQQIEKADLRPLVARATVRTGTLAVAFLAGLALAWALAVLPLIDKASARLGDLVRGEFTGLSITPGSLEVAAGDDLVINVEINRGPSEARIVFEFADGPMTYDMFEKEGNLKYFELFSIDAPFTYRIVTPTLESRVFTVSTFANPAIIAAAIRVEPPAYTGLEAQGHHELKDLTVPEGANVTIAITANTPVAATLAWDEQPHAVMNGGDDAHYVAEITATASDAFAIILADSYGHIANSERTYNFEVVEDFAPLIEPITPENDAKFTSEDDVTFSCKVTDDYAVDEIILFYAISGRPWEHVQLYKGDPKTWETIQTTVFGLSIPDLDDVYEGDVISYYYAASDNAPNRSTAATEVRFIEIRPEPQEPEKAPPGEGPPPVKIDVKNLITEQKHMIRQTVGLQRLDDDAARAELLDNLGIGAQVLLDAADKVLKDAKEGAGGIHLGDLENLFQDAMDSMKIARDFLQRKNPEASLQDQARALSKLISIAIMIEAAPKSSEQSEQQEGEQASVTEKNEQDERGRELDRLKEAIEKLKDLIDRQENLNAKFEIRKNKIMPSASRGFMAGTETKIRDQLDDLKGDLAELPRATEATYEMTKASRAMGHWVEQIENANDEQVTKSGEQAVNFMERSKQMLEEIRDSLSGDELEALNEELQAIRKEQQQLRRATEKAPDAGKPKRQEMAGQQKQIREKFDQFMDSLSEAAKKTEPSNPEASESLSQCRNSGNAKGTSGSMKRAENGLKYGRTEKASTFQRDAEEAMREMAAHMRNAMNARPGMSGERLTRMLEETLKNIEKAQKAAKSDQTTEQEREELLKEFSQDLDKMAEQMNDQQMSELSMQMHGWNIGQSEGGKPLREALGLLIETAQLLEGKLFANAFRKQIELARVNGREPPDEYKKRVQEYFKRLSNDAQ